MANLTIEDFSRTDGAFPRKITFSSKLERTKRVYVRINDTNDEDTGVYIDQDNLKDLVAFLECQLKKD
jgi:hypothetical protein